MSDFIHSSSHPYVEAAKKYEDTKSTACTFIPAGILGLLFLALLWSSLIPLSFSFFTKCMFSAVLGFLFLFFLFTGIRSFRELELRKAQMQSEEASVLEIRQWFLEHYSADEISSNRNAEDLSPDQLYFLRSENISRLMQQEFSSLTEEFLDYMSEKIYQMYFPDEESLLY